MCLPVGDVGRYLCVVEGSERGSSRGWRWETEVCEVDFMERTFQTEGALAVGVGIYSQPSPFLTLVNDTFCPTWLYICCEESTLNIDSDYRIYMYKSITTKTYKVRAFLHKLAWIRFEI